jgi:hypothetical protein
VITAVILLVAMGRKSANEAAAQRQREANAAAQAEARAEAAAVAAKQSEDRQRKLALEGVRAKSAAMTRAQRDSWIWQCFDKLHCDEPQLLAIIMGVPEGAERDRASRVKDAADARKEVSSRGRGVAGRRGHERRLCLSEVRDDRSAVLPVCV